jgi:hypothetical protein
MNKNLEKEDFSTMKKTVLATLVLALLAAPGVPAANAGFDINIHLNDGSSRSAPAPAPAPVVAGEAPLFLFPPSLGFAVAVGTPYDMVYLSGNYFIFRSNAWYSGASCNGPWKAVAHDRLPPGLRRYKVKRIRYYRDEEYRHYRKEGRHYRGRSFRPQHSRDHEQEREKHNHGKHRGWN